MGIRRKASSAVVCLFLHTMILASFRSVFIRYMSRKAIFWTSKALNLEGDQSETRSASCTNSWREPTLKRSFGCRCVKKGWQTWACMPGKRGNVPGRCWGPRRCGRDRQDKRPPRASSLRRTESLCENRSAL